MNPNDLIYQLEAPEGYTGATFRLRFYKPGFTTQAMLDRFNTLLDASRTEDMKAISSEWIVQ